MKKYKYDFYREYGTFKEPFFKKFVRPNGIKYLVLFRNYQETKSVFFKYIYKYRLIKLSKKTFIQIPPETQIGAGFYIGHDGRVVINGKTIIGKNVNISTGVVIGKENRGKRAGYPKIGDQVWIGANAVIVGNIKIGNDVLIAPLSFVNFDIPDHSIVIGNPAKIISKQNATEGYINRKV